MGVINKLESHVYNRIAAGEVVERPYSVVKELVENAIDAGASRVNVEITSGGKQCIVVRDNGVGIAADDMKVAFLSHATSKISGVDDLDKIMTLGFRGEALASIASVSVVEVHSKQASNMCGNYLKLEGGAVVDEHVMDMADGTVMSVSNLFYNTPARAKFLKRDKSEEGDITKLMSDLILANPNVAFSYAADNKKIYSSTGRGLEDAVYSVYSKDITNNLVPLCVDSGDYIVRGYISLPQFTKATRAYQTTVINGRIINNTTISAAVTQAYGNALMRRNFPVFVLDIVVPFDSIDVNVTPSKTDVRFVDSKTVFSKVYHAVKDALLRAQNIFTFDRGYGNAETSKPTKEIEEKSSESGLSLNRNDSSAAIDELKATIDHNYNENAADKTPLFNDKGISINAMQNKIEDDGKISALQNKNNCDINAFDKKNEEIVHSVGNRLNMSEFENINSAPHVKDYSVNVDNLHYNNGERKIIAENQSDQAEFGNNDTANVIGSDDNMLNKRNEIAAIRVQGNNFAPIFTMSDSVEEARLEQTSFINQQNTSEVFNNVDIIGQLFNTYLLVGSGEYAYIIDQHAAHERMIYDKLSREIESNYVSSQLLLVPEIVELSPQDASFVSDILPDLLAIGLDIEEFGNNAFKITAIPTVFGSFKLKRYVEEIVRSKRILQGERYKNILRDKLAITACKAAIKAGDSLSEGEISALIGLMKDNAPLQCPHGRPAIIRIERKDIDKIFKRI